MHPNKNNNKSVFKACVDSRAYRSGLVDWIPFEAFYFMVGANKDYLSSTDIVTPNPDHVAIDESDTVYMYATDKEISRLSSYLLLHKARLIASSQLDKNKTFNKYHTVEINLEKIEYLLSLAEDDFKQVLDKERELIKHAAYGI